MTSGRDTHREAEGIANQKPIPRIAVQAFCETKEIAAVVEAAGQDRRMSKAHVKVQMGGLQAAVEFYGAAPTPNLVIVESKDARDQILGLIDRLAEVCDPGSKVIVVGHINDVILYRELTRRGVSEYVVAPFDVFDLIREIGEIYYNPEATPLGRSIAFIGAKGGCGASTFAHNTAWSISRAFEVEVVIADLDLAWGTAGLDFNLDPTLGIAEAILSPERLDENYLDRLLATVTDRLSLLAAPASLDRAFDLEEDTFEPVIDCARSHVPTVVLDIPHVWNGWTRKTLKAVDEVVVVATPDLASLRNAKNLLDFLKQSRPNDAQPRLVLNMVGVPKRPEIKPEEFSKAVDLPVLATVPFEPQLFGAASNNGQMIAEADSKSPIAETFRAIGRTVTGRGEVRKVKASPLAPFLARLRGRKAG